MLNVKNLTITHRKDLRVILDKFNMTLNDGDKAVIIGEEGNGKSTLMKWIYDPELAEEYAECEGERILGGEVLGYLPQENPPVSEEIPRSFGTLIPNCPLQCILLFPISTILSHPLPERTSTPFPS